MYFFMNENSVKNSSTPKIKFWYLLFVLSVLLWMILIVIAPVLSKSNGVLKLISAAIYRFFSVSCHQMDDRCFHVAGSKMAVCSRCFSIYSGILFSTIIYPFIFRLKKVSFPNPLIFIIPAIILALDYFADNFGAFKNTMLTRSISGFIFGAGIAFYLIPTSILFFSELHDFFKNKNVNK